jgi:hypothetical protein
MGILESIFESPLLIGAITVTALVVYLRTADQADEVLIVAQKPFSWLAGATTSTASWLDRSIDDNWISVSELPDFWKEWSK